MPFTKTVTIPGGYTASYFAINRISRIDEGARDAEFIIKVWKDAAAHAAKEPGIEAATVRFTAAAFDLYFAKSVMTAQSVNAYAVCYAAMADLTAAIKARAALKVTPVPTPPPPALTPHQQTLLNCASIRSDPRYGGELIYDGVSPA
jgi:hypothetical protein